ncbi:MAG: response regulator [Planctomycetota bacterium]|jgi:DNA-binding NtrC family response regulator
MDLSHILIVDDEEDLASTLAERLELRGFQVTAVTSGAEALDVVSANRFSVLILDVKMPGIGGLELMTRIKQEQPDLPVILFTGHSSLADAEKGIEEGAFAYLQKPIKIDKLVETVKGAIGGSEAKPHE